MNRKISLGATLGMILLAVTLTVTLTMQIAMRTFNDSVASLSERQAMYAHVDAIDKIVREYYTTLDEENLQRALAEGYVAGLNDPYAAYLTAEEHREAKLLEEEGKVFGFGFNYVTLEGNAVVSLVHTSSPAYKAGLRRGDVIRAIDGVTIDATNRLSVLAGIESKESMLLSATREDKALSFDLAAAQFVPTTVSEQLFGTIGYIRIRNLYSSTAAEFKAAYTAMEEAGATAFIYDVRGNVSTDLDTADALLEYLMPRCSYAFMAENSGKYVTFTVQETHQSDAPSVVLVDETTGCAAEMFAAAMQKFSKSTVVGVKTAGHGKVQERFSIKTDNSAVLLTVGQIIMDGSVAIEGAGVTPNITADVETTQKKLLEFLTVDNDAPLRAAITALDSTYFAPKTEPPVTEPATEPATAEPATGESTTTATTQK